MKIGETIVTLRKERNLSQEDFAKLFFVTRQTISNWENEKSYPDLQTLIDMSEKFDISLDTMLKENTQIVKKYDKNRSFAKFAKICFAVLGGLLSIYIILLCIWNIVWSRTNQSMEAKYNAGIKQYGFEFTEFPNMQHRFPWAYTKEVDENTVFWVQPFYMAPRSSFYLGAYNQGVLCRLQRESQLIEIGFYGDSMYPNGSITIYDKYGDHHLTNNADILPLLDEDEQLASLWRQCEEITAALFDPYIWGLHSGFNPELKDNGNFITLKRGDEAPDFTVLLTDGSTFTLSEQKGKVVLLNFWATWCDPCVMEMPAFEQIKEEFEDQVAVIAVNRGEKTATVDRFLNKTGYTFPIAIDEQETLRTKYPSSGIPYTLVIDADGVIREIHLGGSDADAMYPLYRSYIKAALAEN